MDQCGAFCALPASDGGKNRRDTGADLGAADNDDGHPEIHTDADRQGLEDADGGVRTLDDHGNGELRQVGAQDVHPVKKQGKTADQLGGHENDLLR